MKSCLILLSVLLLSGWINPPLDEDWESLLQEGEISFEEYERELEDKEETAALRLKTQVKLRPDRASQKIDEQTFSLHSKRTIEQSLFWQSPQENWQTFISAQEKTRYTSLETAQTQTQIERMGLMLKSSDFTKQLVVGDYQINAWKTGGDGLSLNRQSLTSAWRSEGAWRPAIPLRGAAMYSQKQGVSGVSYFSQKQLPERLQNRRVEDQINTQIYGQRAAFKLNPQSACGFFLQRTQIESQRDDTLLGVESAIAWRQGRLRMVHALIPALDQNRFHWAQIDGRWNAQTRSIFFFKIRERNFYMPSGGLFRSQSEELIGAEIQQKHRRWRWELKVETQKKRLLDVLYNAEVWSGQTEWRAKNWRLQLKGRHKSPALVSASRSVREDQIESVKLTPTNETGGRWSIIYQPSANSEESFTCGLARRERKNSPAYWRQDLGFLWRQKIGTCLETLMQWRWLDNNTSTPRSESQTLRLGVSTLPGSSWKLSLRWDQIYRPGQTSVQDSDGLYTEIETPTKENRWQMDLVWTW
jgi:hypothetical protein